MENGFYKEFLRIFEPYYEAILATLPKRYAAYPYLLEASQTFFTPLFPLAAKGKRIRPFFIALGKDAFDPVVLDVGVAFELLQMFALVHDDVIDGAATRRGVETAQIAFEKQFPKRGISSAILLGDYLLALANEIMQERASHLLPLFTELQCQLCLGQFYELSHWGNDGAVETAQQISLFKSVQYTFLYPLRAGLLLANRDPQLLDAYANPTGLAFQMRDDWLDVSEEIHDAKTKDLDAQNEVPNIVQTYLKQNNGDLEQTKQQIRTFLAQYKSQAELALASVPLSARQKEALDDILRFCTTID